MRIRQTMLYFYFSGRYSKTDGRWLFGKFRTEMCFRVLFQKTAIVKNYGQRTFLQIGSGGSRISQRRGRYPQKGGAPTYYLVNFSRKLHENEEILGQRGGACPSRPPLDPPLIGDIFQGTNYTINSS